MRPADIGKVFAAAEDSFDRAIASSAKTSAALSRADAVMARVDNRDGATVAAARRERQRLNAGAERIAKRVLIVTAAIWLATMVFGFVRPIGMFGLIAAVVIAALAIAATVGASRRSPPLQAPTPDLPSALLVDRLDSYLFRARPALPAPAQVEVDQLLSGLQGLKPVLDRVAPLEPGAQDARRLMGTHLPNLIDRYLNVPPAMRAEAGPDGVTVNQRLTDALRASREALVEAGQTLAQRDVAAFETQGRFIESRYGGEEIDR